MGVTAAACARSAGSETRADRRWKCRAEALDGRALFAKFARRDAEPCKRESWDAERIAGGVRTGIDALRRIHGSRPARGFETARPRMRSSDRMRLRNAGLNVAENPSARREVRAGSAVPMKAMPV